MELIDELMEKLEEWVKATIDDRTADSDDSWGGSTSYRSRDAVREVLVRIFDKVN